METTETEYWLVGAWWNEEDQTDNFVAQGIWENGYEDRYLDVVKQMKPGDRIAIKAATTQKEGLPFDAAGRTVSKMVIKATGTIMKNLGDGIVAPKVTGFHGALGVRERADASVMCSRCNRALAEGAFTVKPGK